MDAQSLKRPAAPQTQEIIGRKKERQAILEAIAGQETCVLHFIGEAGIGKTRQLREVVRWYAAQKEGRAAVQPLFEWLGLVDLYHSDLHTPSMVERHIIGKIDPGFETNRKQSPFRTYLEKRDLFEERRRQGRTSERERAELTQVFVNDYNNWGVGHRAVIAFDTLEVIVYEEDRVLKLCEGEAGSADVKGWLLEVLPQLRNTVILLASRPYSSLEAEFEKRFDAAQVCYRRFVLTRLNEEDAKDYLEDIFAQRPDIKEALEDPDSKPADFYHEIWHYTGGVPILMGLVIDLVAFGNVGALRKLRDQASGDMARVRKLLVDELREIKPPIWNTLRCLNVARKGLTPELFQRLMAEDKWGLEKCREELDRLKGTVLVKSREGTPALFLHDALYDMFDEHEPFPLVDPGRLLPMIVGHYEEQIEACEEKLQENRNSLRDLDLRERTGADTLQDIAVQRDALLKASGEWERKRQQLLVEVVYYKLWRDPVEGFELYARLYNEALKAREIGFDARLHDEVLRYVKSALYAKSQQKRLPISRFLRHCVLRWVKLHLARTDPEGYGRAARVAKRMLETSSPLLGGAEAQADLLYQAELRLWRAEALIYLGQGQEAEKWLGESLKFLQPARARHLYRHWRRSRLIGRAHNDLGYIYWSSQRYGDSVREYRQAIAQFREADVKDELADTLNNLAYVYSILGEASSARALVENARELREREGRNHPLALSWNTTGEILAAANQPEEALQWCERARAEFADAKDPRGLGMSYIGLGRAYRKVGEKAKRGEYSFVQAQRHFEEAVRCLDLALGIFGGTDPQVAEPYRHWEALNELGSTYVDWAYLLTWHGLREQAEEKDRLSVQYQEQAAEVAKKANFKLQLLDTYDDLAQAYADWGKLDKARDCLRKVDQAVPKGYRLVKGRGFRKLAAPVDGYWLVLGKYHLQLGIWACTEADQKPQEKDRFLAKSARHFAMAVAYFQQFSRTHINVDVTSRAMYRRFKTLKMERLVGLRSKIQDVAREYRVDLSSLLGTLDDTLGSPSP